MKSAIQEENKKVRVHEVQREAVPQDESSISDKARKWGATLTDAASKSIKKDSELGKNSLRSSVSGQSCKPDNSNAHDTTTDSAIQKDQEVLQDQSSIPKNARKWSATPPRSDVKKPKKKGNGSGGKLFRSSLQVSSPEDQTKATKKYHDSVYHVLQQDAGPAMHYGIDQNIASKINMQETTCSFPEYKQPLKENGSNIICEKDLEVLLGGQALD